MWRHSRWPPRLPSIFHRNNRSTNKFQLCSVLFIRLWTSSKSKVSQIPISTYQELIKTCHFYIIFSQNICIRQESGYCCITYNVCSDTNSWAFDNIAATSLVNTECTTDFIEITGITYTCETQELNTRLCGSVFQIVKGATVANGNAHSLCGEF